MKKNILLPAASLILFALLFRFGVFFSTIKPMENDEIHSQVHSIDNYSYWDQLLGRMGGLEGNNSPLFYMLQKAICDSVGYKSPDSWAKGERSSFDPYSMVLLRLQPNFFMSMTGVLIFYFFTLFYGWGMGVLSIGFFLSSACVLMHWTEARPYSLWFFLTGLQSTLLLAAVLKEFKDEKIKWGLAAVHVMLSLTVILSLGQIVIASILLWLLKERDWKYHIWLTILPGFLCMLYFRVNPENYYFLTASFLSTVNSNIAIEAIIFSLGYGGFLILYALKNNGIRTIYPESDGKQDYLLWRAGQVYFVLFVLMLAAALALYLGFWAKDTEGLLGNKISSRYWLFLSPVGIIAFVLFASNLWKAFRGNRWMRVNIALVVLGTLTIIYLKNYSLWVLLGYLRKYAGQ